MKMNYDHECAIMEEKDVLYSDIIGKSFYFCVKRWWQDLFLVSYSDDRARAFYSSSEAMRVERVRQYRHHRNCIHPLSKIRNFWDGFIFFVVIANSVTFQHNTSIVFDQMAICLYYIGSVFEFILLLDIYINLKTGYIDHEARICILDRKASIVHYCSTKLFGHVAGTLPLQSMLFVKYGKNVDCGICKSNMFLIVLQMLNCLTVFRLYDASSFCTKERSSYRYTYVFRFFRVCILGLTVMQHFINVTDAINYLTFIETQHIDPKAYNSLILEYKWLKNYSDSLLVCIDLIRVCKSLFLFGFGFKKKYYYVDRLSAVIGYLIGSAFYIAIMLEINAYISRFMYPKNQLLYNKNRTINMLRCRQLPDKIKYKICQYYDFNMAKLMLLEQQNGLYKLLPVSLKTEIKLNDYIRYIMRIPYFFEWPINMMEDIALMLKEEIYMKNDIVADAWTQGDGFVIVDAGVMAVFSIRHEETGHLIDGDYFGDLSLVTDREVRMSYVIAVTDCKALVLHKHNFRQYMREYPEMFFALKSQLREKYNKSQELESQ